MLVPALKPWSGAVPGVVPISRLSQPTRARGAGVGVLDLLHGVEVRAVGDRQPGGVHRGDLAGLPQRDQGGHRRVQAEQAVLDEQPVGGDRDAGAGAGSSRGRRAGRPCREPVGAAAQRDHDEDRAGAGRHRRGGGDDRAADHGRGTGEGERAAEHAAARTPAVRLPLHRGVLVAAGSRGVRESWSSWSPAVVVGGVEDGQASSRPNFHWMSSCSSVIVGLGLTSTALQQALSSRASECRCSSCWLRWSTSSSKRTCRAGHPLLGLLVARRPRRPPAVGQRRSAGPSRPSAGPARTTTRCRSADRPAVPHSNGTRPIVAALPDQGREADRRRSPRPRAVRDARPQGAVRRHDVLARVAHLVVDRVPEGVESRRAPGAPGRSRCRSRGRPWRAS